MGEFCMKPLTRDWIAKAEGDYVSAKREYRARKAPNYDAACFHAQQCIEKYLKAWLCEQGVSLTKTHNLLHLLDQCIVSAPLWDAMRTSLNVLNLYAVAFRYPEEFADKAGAADAVAICRTARESIRQTFQC